MRSNLRQRRLPGSARFCSLLAGLLLVGSRPVAPQVKDGPASALADDPRLAIRITASVPGAPLGEVVPQLSRAAGVRLSLAPELTDERVLLFGPTRPAREILDDLAALLDLRWDRSGRGDTAPSYRLSRPPEAVRRLRQWEAEVVRRARERVDAHARALSETPEQLQQRPERDFARILLQDPEWRAATQFYALLSDAQKEALFTRKQLLFPLATLGPMLEAPLREVYLRRVKQEDEFFNSPEGQEALRKARPGDTVVRHRPEDLERNAFRLQALRADGYLSVGMNLGSGPTATSVTTNEEGQSVLAVNGWPVTLVDTAQLWVLPAHGNPYGPAPEDPAARERFGEAAEKLKAEEEWIERLRALSVATGQPVLSDDFRGAPVNRSPAESALDERASPGTRRLDRFCAGAQSLWWTRGASLLLRRRDWFTRAAYELPESWLARAQQRLSTQEGAVRTPDVALAAELTAAQWDGLAALARGGLVNDSSDGEAVRALLALTAPTLRLRDRVLPATFSLADLLASQHNRVAQLGQQLGWVVSPEEARAFQLQLTAGPRQASDRGEFIPLQVVCGSGPGHQVRATLYLPLALKETRQRKLVIEREALSAKPSVLSPDPDAAFHGTGGREPGVRGQGSSRATQWVPGTPGRRPECLNAE